MTVAKLADGTEIDLLPVGRRIILRGHSEITGRIIGYEWNKPGVLSAIPYRVQWDDDSSASKFCGILGRLYQLHENVEAIQ